jgi:hypothetical protein
MIFGLPFSSFLMLYGLPAIVIIVMIFYCWLIARDRD